MIETKKEARTRWQREGRDGKIVFDRRRWTEEFIAAGMTRRMALERAFERALEEYPPLAETTETGWDGWDDEIGAPEVPKSWGNLPDSAPFDAEIEWVHQNMVLVIEDRNAKAPLFHWDRAQKPAPSHGARNLMHFAATNRVGFMNMLQRVKPGIGGDEDVLRREKVRIEEIKRILEEFREAKGDAAELEEVETDG